MQVGHGPRELAAKTHTQVLTHAHPSSHLSRTHHTPFSLVTHTPLFVLSHTRLFSLVAQTPLFICHAPMTPSFICRTHASFHLSHARLFSFVTRTHASFHFPWGASFSCSKPSARRERGERCLTRWKKSSFTPAGPGRPCAAPPRLAGSSHSVPPWDIRSAHDNK